jgi:tetratricopeptide (TPR) repeat protein
MWFSKINTKFFINFLILFFILSNFNFSYAAGSDSSGSDGSGISSKNSLYKAAKNLIYKAKKLEKKNKLEKAKKLYIKAYDKLEKAYKKDQKNADILNYLGFTLRKTGNFEKAENYYLKGLEIDAGHLGINEYLGELYVETNRMELAKKRLAVLQGCDCEEYEELKELIENK